MAEVEDFDGHRRAAVPLQGVREDRAAAVPNVVPLWAEGRVENGKNCVTNESALQCLVWANLGSLASGGTIAARESTIM